MTDAGVYCHAGPEQSVASTKAFMAQVTVLAQVALHIAKQTGKLRRPMIEEFVKLPSKIKKVLDLSDDIKKIAKKYAHHRDFLYIGRNYLYPTALEGALKLKELTYIHAEGFAAGEMKHGPLAMIDTNFPTIALLSSGDLFEKTMSNIQEIKARGGPVIAVVPAGKAKKIAGLADDVIEIPKTLEQLEPLIIAPILQLFAYHMTVIKGFDVDKPRNLAKSVTVE
jgi:glucosamine--fructose-6-phosphate aminotransferase (isomerizing)